MIQSSEAALADDKSSTFEVLDQSQGEAVRLVLEERKRQHAKWGNQNHTLGNWGLILGEEYGEWCEAALHTQFGGPKASGLKAECIQIAAVALQMVEWLNLQDGTIKANASRFEFEHPVWAVEKLGEKRILGWEKELRENGLVEFEIDRFEATKTRGDFDAIKAILTVMGIAKKLSLQVDEFPSLRTYRVRLH